VFASTGQKAERGRAAIGQFCQHTRKVTKSDQFCDIVCTEWLLYATDTALDSAVDQFPDNICAYWLHVSNIVDTEKKYKKLSYIAKAALTLSHRNASPEWGFW